MDLRQWVEQIADGTVNAPLADVLDVVRSLLDEIDALHDKYAHEGGTPQVMTQNILAEWLKALSVPMAFDIYHAGVNVFYVGFSRTLYPDDIRQIEALGFTVVYANSTLRNRYMLKWNPAKDDER